MPAQQHPPPAGANLEHRSESIQAPSSSATADTNATATATDADTDAATDAATADAAARFTPEEEAVGFT